MKHRILYLKFSLIFFFICSGFSLQAQEYPIYNQYHFNYYLVNPAVAGANDCSYFMLTHKQQWVGIEDAPYTSSFSFQSRLKGNIGVGGYVYNDKNGYSTQQGAQLTAAYHIPLSNGARYRKAVARDRQLSFAVSMKFYNYGFDSELYEIVTGNDPAVSDLGSVATINANFGVYYTSYGFFTGFSATNLVTTKMPSYDETTEPDLPFNGFFLLGNEFQVTEDETLEPSLMYKFSAQAEMALDLNLKYMRNVPKDKFSYWAQLTLRQNIDEGSYQTLSMMPMVGFQYNKFHMGYAFDLDLNRLVRYNYGTHEVMLGYTFCYTRRFCR